MQVALYARVSTGSDEQANALEQQLARLEAAASAHSGASPQPSRYIDIASGSRDDRPELTRLLADCSAGLIGTVIVTRLDRLSRSSSHGAQLLRYFSQDQSPNLIALDDSLDLATAGGRFMGRLLISWAEAETDRLAERTRHGHAHRRSQRKIFGSRPLWAYRFNASGDGLEADPELWPIAEAAVAHFLKHGAISTTREWLHTEHGTAFGSNYSLRRWLCNPTLTGARAYGQQVIEVDPATGRKRKVPRPPGEYKEVHWADDNGQPFQPPLLTREQHAWILSVFHARAQASGRPLATGSARPLTGLVTCADCGRNMHHHRPGKCQHLTLRCVAIGCPSRYRSIREQEVRFAMLAHLQSHAEQLMLEVDRMAAAKAGTLSPAAQAISEQIHQLEAMDDPDLQPVLDKKREKLSQLLAATTSDGPGTFLQQMDAFLLPEIGAASEDDPESTRKLLQRFIRAEAAGGELVTLTVAEGIRRPGKSASFDVRGMGLGQRPKPVS